MTDKTTLHQSKSISALDIHFARLMARLSESKNEALFLAAVLVSSQTRAGHVCLDLNDLCDSTFLREQFGDDLGSLPVTALQEIESTLAAESVVVGRPGEFKPLILDSHNRLYLNRYWRYQEALARFIKNSGHLAQKHFDSQELKERLDRFFAPPSAGEVDWQKVAVIIAVMRKFCVITGGPGTGKTFTVAKIIAILLELSGDDELRVVLAAPTGKAAVRLQEAIQAAKEHLPCTPHLKAAIPEEASTLHRLLGTRRYSPYFRHNADRPLEVDVLVVDEASMVDIALMSKLVQALPPHARLILLGDSNQLASVEAGAVLADICPQEQVHTFSTRFASRLAEVYGRELPVETVDSEGVHDSIVLLQKSYRFASQKGIGEISSAVNAGDGAGALNVLKADDLPDVSLNSLSEDGLKRMVLQPFQTHSVLHEPAEMFARFARFRILCAVREGPQGVSRINARIEEFNRKELGVKRTEIWYPGQPILIARNDYQMHLFNGDFGIILPDPDANNELKAYFPAGGNAFRKIRPFRLPEHETAYAMTVHKSQGSEFEHVLLLLPAMDSPILTRELIYTGITRAARSVEIWGDEGVFKAAVARRVKRASGLREALWGATDFAAKKVI
ncbi:MAG: exodeoxyribonuclease V subunit alpha [bacterium]